MTAASPWCQRWDDRRHSWRHVSDGGFDWRNYEVHAIDTDNGAKPYILRHHYSGSFPSASFRYGLYQADRLVGMAIYGTPGHDNVVVNVFPELRPYSRDKGVTQDTSTCLSRFVLNDEVPANAESWFIARTFEELTVAGIRGVVSFSDPVPIKAEDGTLVMPGHVGIIYQASNATYLGRTRKEKHLLMPNGVVWGRRQFEKIEGQKQGHASYERRLVSFGAPPLRAGEDPRVWLTHALEEIGARPVRHPGKHRYAFRLGSKRERSQIELGLPTFSPYPKQRDQLAA